MKNFNPDARAPWQRAGFPILFVLFILGMTACSDDSERAELSPAVRQYLSMRMGSNSAMAESMSGPMNQSFQNLLGRGLRQGKIGSDSVEAPGDTTIISDPWESCAQITTTTNADGSVTTIYDYGTGCEEGAGDYRYIIQGKYASTYRESYTEEGSSYKQSYLYGTTYDNYGVTEFGGSSWLLNGGGTYQGESHYNWETGIFSGFYSYDDETTYRYDSVTYFYKSKGATKYDNEKFTVESSDNDYTFGDDFYKSKVLKSLVIDFTCFQQKSETASMAIFWLYTSGRERIQFKSGDETGSFEIDYGNGECDNIVTIYENGRVTQIDLAKELNGDDPVVMQ